MFSVRATQQHTQPNPIDVSVDSSVQAGQSSTVIENIHTIIAAAAVKFSFDQLTHLFLLIQKVSTDLPEVNQPSESFVSWQVVLIMHSLCV